MLQPPHEWDTNNRRWFNHNSLLNFYKEGATHDAVIARLLNRSRWDLRPIQRDIGGHALQVTRWKFHSGGQTRSARGRPSFMDSLCSGAWKTEASSDDTRTRR